MNECVRERERDLIVEGMERERRERKFFPSRFYLLSSGQPIWKVVVSSPSSIE